VPSLTHYVPSSLALCSRPWGAHRKGRSVLLASINVPRPERPDLGREYTRHVICKPATHAIVPRAPIQSTPSPQGLLAIARFE
jgi:hypothetical protein